MSVIGNEFSGLPIADLIGGPLKAACDAQVRLATATANFINTVGFNPILDSQRIPTGQMVPRQVDFAFWQPTPMQKEVLATGSVSFSLTEGGAQPTNTADIVSMITIGTDDLWATSDTVPFHTDLKQTALDVASKINSFANKKYN